MVTLCRGICLLKYETRSIYGENTEGLPKCRRCYLRINSNRRNCPCCGTNLSRRTVYKSKIHHTK